MISQAVVSAILTIGIGIAYVLLGTIRFRVATAAVLRYAEHLGIPHILPEWFPPYARRWFPLAFRWSARLFFLGCAYTHFEIAAHLLADQMPVEYEGGGHQLPMFLQLIGVWFFVFSLTLIDDALSDPMNSDVE